MDQKSKFCRNMNKQYKKGIFFIGGALGQTFFDIFTDLENACIQHLLIVSKWNFPSFVLDIGALFPQWPCSHQICA